MESFFKIHQGQRLKECIKDNKIKAIDLVNDMQLSNYQHLYYYYNSKEIKSDTLEKFLKYLNISKDKFFKTDSINDETTNVVNEDKPVYKSYHQGKNLKAIITAKHINVTSLCYQLNISRPTLYKYFDERELPLSVLLEMAHIIEVPVARIKGIGQSEKSFEKDIYLQLEALNNKVAELTKLLLKE